MLVTKGIRDNWLISYRPEVDWPSNDWQELLSAELEAGYFRRLLKLLYAEYASETVYPASNRLFNALNLTSYAGTRVVLIGQDPYHGEGQAHGLAFSVKSGVGLPPSLRNIYRELASDLGVAEPTSGDLTPWAKQGVLLLNTVLSVRANQPNSHQGLGWEGFTDRIITLLNEREEPVIFLLWGRNAESKGRLITADHHYILRAAHPSPLSAYRGFFGSRHFSQVNTILRELGQSEIDWSSI